MNATSEIAGGLNPVQQQAVCQIQGPVLVLAGPGSGKTRVITHRIANIIAQGVRPDNILALTFTNKAAEEMVHRIEKLVPNAHHLWISTFHSFCARILRRECEALGYAPSFSIYDVDDQKRAIKSVVTELKLEGAVEIDTIRHIISHAKNHCIPPQQLTQGTFPPSLEYKRKQQEARIYTAYQDFLKKNNALDFDDLLLKTLELFTHYKDVTERYQEKFHYILVDEFQDTNLPQYYIAKILAQKYRNICATGDPDQSIYSWRGANIKNILEFEKDFPDAAVIKLEQNYRSTKVILQAASQLIAHNQQRKQKALWTENPPGELIRVLDVYDDTQQAAWVCQDIGRLRHSGFSLKDIVVFYRTNAQSRAIETELRTRGVPYTIVGGLEFYERAEIKDLLAYLRLLVNERDDISLGRILNVPPRAIGKTTAGELETLARAKGLTMWQGLQQEEILENFGKRAKNALENFVRIIADLRAAQFSTLAAQVEAVLEQTGYLEYIRKQDKSKDEEREENLKEFVASVREYEKRGGEKSLVNFLERVSLIADVDRWEQDLSGDGQVTLMTLHAAKGLEFPVVYIIGFVEGLIPHARSVENLTALEEERRLAFVGITRAQKKLTICYSQISYRYEITNNIPSRFLQEIPTEICQLITPASSKQAASYRHEDDDDDDRQGFGRKPYQGGNGPWNDRPPWSKNQGNKGPWGRSRY